MSEVLKNYVKGIVKSEAIVMIFLSIKYLQITSNIFSKCLNVETLQTTNKGRTSLPIVPPPPEAPISMRSIRISIRH